MKKKLKEKKSEKKEKYKAKNVHDVEKNRSIGENEGKMGQKDDIRSYFFECVLLVLQILCENP